MDEFMLDDLQRTMMIEWWQLRDISYTMMVYTGKMGRMHPKERNGFRLTKCLRCFSATRQRSKEVTT